MKYIFSILFTIFSISCIAQTDSLFYLNKAMSKLEAGDCEAARKYYKVYKEVYNGNKPIQSIEVLLEECTKDTFAVGETIMKDGRKYIVAYTRDGGKHGFAVSNEGWYHLDDYKYYYGTDKYGATKYEYYSTVIERRGIPTLDELKEIYKNRDKLRLYDIYWSCTEIPKKGYDHYKYKLYDFSSGIVIEGFASKKQAVVLLIYRF